MDSDLPPTVVAALTARTSTDATRPRLTYYDDGTGERTELSGATLANWVAKTANLLVDGLGLGAGDTAAVRLPAHWQTGAVLLGCWSAGLSVDLGGTGTGPASATGPVAVAFASADRLGEVAADETFALALAPLAAPFRPGPPPGTSDYVVEVRSHGDHFAPAGIGPHTAALADGMTHADLVALAATRGVPSHARVLVDADVLSDPISWLVAPLVVDSSVVLCRSLDPARLQARLAGERAIAYP